MQWLVIVSTRISKYLVIDYNTVEDGGTISTVHIKGMMGDIISAWSQWLLMIPMHLECT